MQAADQSRSTAPYERIYSEPLHHHSLSEREKRGDCFFSEVSFRLVLRIFKGSPAPFASKQWPSNLLHARRTGRPDRPRQRSRPGAAQASRFDNSFDCRRISQTIWYAAFWEFTPIPGTSHNAFNSAPPHFRWWFAIRLRATGTGMPVYHFRLAAKFALYHYLSRASASANIWR
jgi:hypothetical protein